MDEKAKRERIEAIENEVQILHPLLHSIFNKLKNLVYVEYTHGPNEKGADFIIQRIDEEIGSSHYVGVIAKTDKVLQNFTDIERQIDECSHARLIRQGKEEVRLPEVWVITSKSVSQNAKEKINEKFSARTIHFFDSDWLVRKVDAHAPYFWEQISSAVGVYLTNTEKRIATINSQTIVSSGFVSPIAIDLDVYEIESDRYTKQAKVPRVKLVNIVDEVAENKISWLEADMGYGKSYLARNVVRHYAESSVYKDKKILPILSSFKRYMDESKKIHDFIRSQIDDAVLRDTAKDKAIFLVVLDGVDETGGDPSQCKSCLDGLIAQVREVGDIRLLLTTRPLRSFDNDDVSSVHIKRYRIRPLSVGKIIQYLRRVVEDRQLPSRLLDDLARSELFKKLPQNPIAAALLGNLIAQDRYELPSNLTELYAKTMELMMGRWDERRLISTEKLFKATERLARYLARHMIDNQLTSISKAEVKEMFAAFMRDRNTGVPLDEVFGYLFDRSNLFGVFPDTNSVFFKHRSFAEYLYARDAYEKRDFRIDDRAFQPYWINTFFFYIGSLGECPDVLRELIRLKSGNDSARMLRMLNMGNFLLAGYETPYNIIEDSLDTLLVEAASIYLEVRNGRMLPKLGHLSEMQLLWLFAMSMRLCYGYKFFEKGLPYAMAKIDDSLPDSDEVKIYSLFFAASALKELNNDCGFEFLLEKRKARDLPMSIALALRSELEHATKEFASTPLVKQYSKNLRKLMYADNKVLELARDAKIDSLFKEPLNAKLQTGNGKAPRKRNKVPEGV